MSHIVFYNNVVINEVEVFTYETTREAPIPLTVGETIRHRTFGDGIICKVSGNIVYVAFSSVGEKKFLNPDAFSDGYLSLARLI